MGEERGDERQAERQDLEDMEPDEDLEDMNLKEKDAEGIVGGRRAEGLEPDPGP